MPFIQIMPVIKSRQHISVCVLFKFPFKQNFFGYIIDQTNNANDISIIISHRIFYQFQIFSYTILLDFNDVLSSFSCTENFTILFHGKFRIFFVFADFQIRLASNIPCRILSPSKMPPIMCRKNVTAFCVLEENIRRNLFQDFLKKIIIYFHQIHKMLLLHTNNTATIFF